MKPIAKAVVILCVLTLFPCIECIPANSKPFAATIGDPEAAGTTTPDFAERTAEQDGTWTSGAVTRDWYSDRPAQTDLPTEEKTTAAPIPMGENAKERKKQMRLKIIKQCLDQRNRTGFGAKWCKTYEQIQKCAHYVGLETNEIKKNVPSICFAYCEGYAFQNAFNIWMESVLKNVFEPARLEGLYKFFKSGPYKPLLDGLITSYYAVNSQWAPWSELDFTRKTTKEAKN